MNLIDTISKSLFLLSVVAGCFFLSSCQQYYEGEPSDHFDGERFFNPNDPTQKTFGDVLKWYITRTIQAWPDFSDNPLNDQPPKQVIGNQLRVSFVGHATVLIQTYATNILIDPIWSTRASPVSWAGPKRVHPPGIAFNTLPPIHLVLISHNHYDHMDKDTILRLHKAHNPLFIVPLGNDTIMKKFHADLKVKVFDWSEMFQFSDKVTIGVERTHHWSARSPFDRNKALWSAFMIQTPGSNIYYSGDTGLGDSSHFSSMRKKYGAIRLAILPIGAYEPRWFMKPYHLNPDEAVQAHQLLQAKKSLGVHYKTFYRLTDEAYHQPLLDLAAARKKYHVADDDFIALDIGQHWWVP